MVVIDQSRYIDTKFYAISDSPAGYALYIHNSNVQIYF